MIQKLASRGIFKSWKGPLLAVLCLSAAACIPSVADDTHQSYTFTVDLRQDYGRTAESGAFVIDLREADSKAAISNLFVLDLREGGTPTSSYSNIFSVDLRLPQDQAIFFDDFDYPSIDGAGGMLAWNRPDGQPVWLTTNKQNLDLESGSLLLSHSSTGGFGLSQCGTAIRTSSRFGPGTFAAVVKFDNGMARENNHTSVQSFGASSESSDATPYYSELELQYLPWDGWENPAEDYLNSLWAASWGRDSEAYKKGESFKANLGDGAWYGLLIDVSPERATFKVYRCDTGGCGWTEMDTGYGASGAGYPPDSDMAIALANWLSPCTLDKSGQRVCPPAPAGCATGYEEHLTTMAVDWVFFQKDIHLSFPQVAQMVEDNLRSVKRVCSPEATSPFAAPSSLVASAVGSSAVNLGWAHPGGASGYSLAWKTERSSWIDSGETASETAVEVTNLQPGTKYIFKVRAIDQRGWASDFSPEASATTVGTPGTFALLSWLPPIDGGANPPVDLKVTVSRGRNGFEGDPVFGCPDGEITASEGPTLTGYDIYRAVADRDPDYAPIIPDNLPPDRLYIFDDQIPNADNIYYRAKASYDSGESGWSNTASFQMGIPGDCDGNGAVSIGEVQKSINMFLGLLPPSCSADCDGNGQLTIGELQKVINAFLSLPATC